MPQRHYFSPGFTSDPEEFPSGTDISTGFYKCRIGASCLSRGFWILCILCLLATDGAIMEGDPPAFAAEWRKHMGALVLCWLLALADCMS
jgi:hypothetical protein